jgi:hypothetical protein
MPYIVVKNENAVLSRVSPNALLSWVDIGVSRATDYRYAITFETWNGAWKCSRMQGGYPVGIGADEPPPMVWNSLFTGGVGAGGDDCGLVEVG